jgi:hypothetical protein
MTCDHNGLSDEQRKQIVAEFVARRRRPRIEDLVQEQADPEPNKGQQ